MIIYIDNTRCVTLQDFIQFLNNDSLENLDVRADILDCIYDGRLVEWLREINEDSKANMVSLLNTKVGDTQICNSISEIFTGKSLNLHKQEASACFSINNVSVEGNEKEIEVSVFVNVILFVNENYEIKVVCDWGTKVVVITPYNIHDQEKFTVVFKKRTGRSLNKIEIFQGENPEFIIERDNETFKFNYFTSLEYQQELLKREERLRMIEEERIRKEEEERKAEEKRKKDHEEYLRRKEEERIRKEEEERKAEEKRKKDHEEYLRRKEEERIRKEEEELKAEKERKKNHEKYLRRKEEERIRKEEEERIRKEEEERRKRELEERLEYERKHPFKTFWEKHWKSVFICSLTSGVYASWAIWLETSSFLRYDEDLGMVENANMGIYDMLLAFLAGLWFSVNMILDMLEEWTKRPSVKEIILAILVSLGTLFTAAGIGIILWIGFGIIFIIFGGILDLIFDPEPDGVMGWMAPRSTWCYIFTLIGFLCTSVLPTCRSFAREEGIADDNDWREVLSVLLLFICIVIVIVFTIVNLIGSCF